MRCYVLMELILQSAETVKLQTLWRELSQLLQARQHVCEAVLIRNNRDLRAYVVIVVWDDINDIFATRHDPEIKRLLLQVEEIGKLTITDTYNRVWPIE